LKEYHEHENCLKCVKIKKQDNSKYFSFPNNHVAYVVLAKRGLEFVLLYDEKQSCEIMEKYHLKAIDVLCKYSPSKSSLWYRHFFK